MPIIIEIIARIERRSDIPYIGVYFVVISNSKYYIYAAKLSRIPVPSYCLKYIYLNR